MNNNLNKTFKDLQKGDKIYAVVTDLPKLRVTTLVIKHIEERYSGAYEFAVSWTENIDSVSRAIIHSQEYGKDKCSPSGWRYVYWHTNEEEARKTIKEAIKYRIKKKEQVIRESKRALENYKRELKEYEDC